jgi:hypothetical protein
MAPEFVPVVDHGLGNTTWMLGPGDGRALVVDAGGDLRGVHAAARARGRTVAYAAEPGADLPPGPVVPMCGHGERATTAASLLERAGSRDVAMLPAGAGEWAPTTGRVLEVTA